MNLYDWLNWEGTSGPQSAGEKAAAAAQAAASPFASGSYQNPTLSYFMPGGNQPPSWAGALTSPIQAPPQAQYTPLPPVRPANLGNSAGAGLQALHNNLTGGGSIPLPPPRPQNLQAAPSANQLLQANAEGLPWNSKQHGLLDNILHAFGQNNGLGGAIGGLGQGISNGLNGIFSGLFNNNGAGA